MSQDVAGQRGLDDAGTPHVRTPVALWRAIRPRQWLKNTLVLIAPGAGGELTHGPVAGRAASVFAIFCAAASATYLVNDVADADADRAHPTKRTRPVASGVLAPRVALIAAAVLGVASLLAAWRLAGWQLLTIVAVYGAVTVAYSLWIKHIVVVELIAVSAAFVLRAIAGGVATGVPLSKWFLVVTSFGALFLVIGKRVGEQSALGATRSVQSAHRIALGLYTPQFLRSALTMSATALVTTYCLWAFDRTGLSGRGHHLVWIELSVVPVIAGVLYVLSLLDAGKGGSPTELALRDRTLQVLALAWAILVAVGVYA